MNFTSKSFWKTTKIFNPFWTGVWNDVVDQGGNFLPRFSFDAITLLEWPQVTNNCLSYENLGFFLCIDTKNSSLCSVVLKLWPCKQRRSKLKFSSKTDKNLKFWATDEFYTSKESWKHVTFIFLHKKTIFCKNFFFGKFDFCIEGPPLWIFLTTYDI